MSCSQNSLKGGYTGNYVGILMAHIGFRFLWLPADALLLPDAGAYKFALIGEQSACAPCQEKLPANTKSERNLEATPYCIYYY